MTGVRFIAFWAAVSAAACGGPEIVDRPGESRIVQVVVAENHLGLLDPAPAHAEAAEICGETLQRAVFFRGDDLGDRRMLHFRCE